MSNCTTRKDDWSRFGNALIGRGPARHSNPVISYVLLIGHTGKNIVVEELRRMGFTINGKRC